MTASKDDSSTEGSADGGSDGEGGAAPRKMVSSMSQLVARMVFRRRETSRTLANRKLPASASREYISSPLLRAVVPDNDVDDGDIDSLDVQEQQWS
jgi:hypothetical protein